MNKGQEKAKLLKEQEELHLNLAKCENISHRQQNQIAELQRKIQLLEGERAAYHESSQVTIQKNREEIRQMRRENESLRKKLAQSKAADQSVTKVAFQNRGLEKEAYRNMSVKDALTKVEQEVLSKRKRLNALKHNTQTQQRRLEGLQQEFRRMKPEASGGARPADAHTRKIEEDAMKLWALENCLEKARFKCKVAENITMNYLKLKNHLQEESLTFQGQLDSLEAELLKRREELHNMQARNNDAQFAKETAKADLQQQEELFHQERKERERIIASHRRQVEEHKAQAEDINRRKLSYLQVQRRAMQPDEESNDALRSSPRAAGEEEKVISTFEEALMCIKEATGVTDIQEIVKRFTSQKETHQHLLKLKEENEKMLQQLKEQKELLSKDLEDLKYSGEAKLSSHQQMLEECERKLQAAEQRRDASKEGLNQLVKAVSTVRAGVEHLVDKLQHITLSEDTETEVSPDSDEYVLVLMSQCEWKLKMLLEQLQGKDLATVRKEMEEEELLLWIKGKLPSYNTGVNLLEDRRQDTLSDEEESEEDEADILTREELKRQSQLIIDSNSKRKPWKKEDKYGLN